MSSARRLQEDYRRIIGLQDETRGLDDDLPRMRISGQRGVFQIGSGETKSGSAGGEDEDGNAVDPVTPDEGSDNQNDDGSGEGGSGTDPALPNEIEVIDAEESNYDVDDDLYGSNWGGGGAIGFVDCVQGLCIDVIPRGGFIESDSQVPSLDGFNDAYLDELQSVENDYLVSDWQEMSDAALYVFNKFPRAELLGSLGYPYPADYSGWVSNYIGGGLFGPHVVGIMKLTNGIVQGSFDKSNFRVIRFSPNFTSFLPWPTVLGGCLQLSRDENGQWVPSDSSNSSYSSPRSILDLCTPSGDGVQIFPSIDGGTVFWNYSQGTFMSIGADGKKSFGGSSALKGVLPGAISGGGDGPKAVGSPTIAKVYA